jgi:hypothetical protein
MIPLRKGLLQLALFLALAPLFALPPRAPLAHAQSDCFAATREIREIRDSLSQLRNAIDTAAPEAKPGLEKQREDLQARLASKEAESGECWYTIHVHAVRVSDSCAGQRTTPITPDQVAQWVAKANEVYAAARVRFEFDPTPGKGDWAELHDSDVNRLSVELPGDVGWERGRATANELAARYPQKVLLLFRHGPEAAPTGVGFSSTSYSFVAMPGYAATTVCGDTQNAYLLAHEMGHYFGLGHTFQQFKTRGAAAAALRKAGNKPAAFDGDGLAETPPEPYIEELQCGKEVVTILNGIPFPLLRGNIMSYYHGDAKTLSPQQSVIVRNGVERRFADAMDGSGSLIPDERRSYQIVSLSNGKVLEVEGGSKENGTRIRLVDWTGTAQQIWRVKPLAVRDAGSFQIVSVASGKSLTIEAPGTAEGASLIQWDWEARGSQKWRFVQGSTGELMIEAKQSRMVLGIAGGGGAGAGGAAPGARGPRGTRATGAAGVEQSPDRGDIQQRWKLLPVD